MSANNYFQVDDFFLLLFKLQIICCILNIIAEKKQLGNFHNYLVVL